MLINISSIVYKHTKSTLCSIGVQIMTKNNSQFICFPKVHYANEHCTESSTKSLIKIQRVSGGFRVSGILLELIEMSRKWNSCQWNVGLCQELRQFNFNTYVLDLFLRFIKICFMYHKTIALHRVVWSSFIFCSWIGLLYIRCMCLSSN